MYPSWAKWKTRDADGKVWIYSHQPYLDWVFKSWNVMIGHKQELPGECHLPGEDWFNSLQELTSGWEISYSWSEE